MEPTISFGVPFQEYLRWEGISNSMLTELNKSPAHFKYAIQHRREETESMEFGTLIHTAILEPEELATRYIVSPFTGNKKLDRRRKADKEKWEEFLLTAGEKKVIEPEDWEAVQIIRKNIEEHPLLPALLKDISSEVSFQWEHHGVLMKGRCDSITTTLSGILDIKTTKCANLYAFQSSIFRMGYHRQAALYRDGLKACGYDLPYSFIAAVENEPPYNLVLFQIPSEIIELGQKEIANLLKKHQECCENKKWPGYTEEAYIVGIPTWYMNKMGDEYYE